MNNFDVQQIHLQHAYRAHDRRMAERNESLRATFNYALEAIRTTALINGGSVVASLAFAGSLYQGHQPDLAKALLIGPLFYFLIGTVCAGVASGLAYFAQYSFTSALGKYKQYWEHPFIHDLPGARYSRWFGNFWQLAAIIFVVFSYGSLCWGMLCARTLVSSTKLLAT